MEFISANSQKDWDGFITSHLEANFLQSWDWGEFHLSRGKTVIRRLVVKENKIIGAYVGQVETAKRGTYLAIAGGPILDWQNEDLVKAVFDDIAEQARAKNCVFARIRPQLEESAQSRALFKKLGLKPAPIYLSVELAGVLDLTKSEEEILASASQRLRRALRKAEKSHVSVEVSTDVADIHGFYEIQLETAKRQKFVSFSEEFLTKQFESFAKDNDVALYTAKFEGQILAQNFMIFYGNEASYHYGVSTELGTKISGAPMLHMQAMRDARRRGIKRYNFWGITDKDDVNHRFYGVSQFKRGFGVEELRYLHAHDLVLKPLQYKMVYAIEKMRAQHRHV